MLYLFSMAINFPIFVPATVHSYFKEQKDLIPTLENDQEYHKLQKIQKGQVF